MRCVHRSFIARKHRRKGSVVHFLAVILLKLYGWRRERRFA
jgi:hypothetical protein